MGNQGITRQGECSLLILLRDFLSQWFIDYRRNLTTMDRTVGSVDQNICRLCTLYLTRAAQNCCATLSLMCSHTQNVSVSSMNRECDRQAQHPADMNLKGWEETDTKWQVIGTRNISVFFILNAQHKGYWGIKHILLPILHTFFLSVQVTGPQNKIGT